MAPFFLVFSTALLTAVPWMMSAKAGVQPSTVAGERQTQPLLVRATKKPRPSAPRTEPERPLPPSPEEQQRRLQQEDLRNQADAEYWTLAFSSPAERLAYLAEVESVTQPYHALGASLISGKPVEAALLLKAGGDGNGVGVPVAWPPRFKMDLEPGVPPVKAGDWYMAMGRISAVPPSPHQLPEGHLTVVRLVACEQKKCAEVDAPEVLVQRRHPDIKWKQPKTRPEEDENTEDGENLDSTDENQ